MPPLPKSPAQGRWVRLLGEPVTPGQSGYEKPLTGAGILRGLLLKITANIDVTGASVSTTKALRGLVTAFRLKRPGETPVDMSAGIMDWVDINRFFGQGVVMAEDVVPATTTAAADYVSYSYLPMNFGIQKYAGIAGFPMSKGLRMSINWGTIAAVKDANASLVSLSYELWGVFDFVAPGQTVNCVEMFFNEETEQLASGYSGVKTGIVPPNRGLVCGIVRIDQNESAGEKDDLVDVGLNHQSTLYSVMPAVANQEQHRSRFRSVPIAGQYLMVPDVMGLSPLNTDMSTEVYSLHQSTGIQNIRWQAITIVTNEVVKG